MNMAAHQPPAGRGLSRNAARPGNMEPSRTPTAGAHPQPLRDRVVVVTGAAGGIGRAVCARVIQLGGLLVGVDTDGPAGASAVAALTRDGGRAYFIHGDVSNADDVAAYVNDARARFGRVDGFVNNAGVEGVIKPMIDYPVEVFDGVLATNVRGVFLGLKHVLPVMVEQARGAIVNVASVAGITGHANHAAYVASKHAVVGLTRVAAAEVASCGIRVNAVCPGPTNTRMMTSIEEQASPDRLVRKRDILARIPAGRYAEPCEVARLIAFLLGDDAGYIHGAVIPVDGGFTAAI